MSSTIPPRPFHAATPGPRAAALALVALAAACNRNPPALFPVDEQIAVVGQTLTVPLVATDPEGDPLTFGFSGPAVPDLATTAALTRSPDGQAIFTFTPVVTQVGLQVLDLWASDGRHEDHVPLFVEVREAAGAGTVPVFRSPLGAGTVLDLERTDCLQLAVEVEDADTARVELGEAPPLVEGARLEPAPDGRTGTWSWCPSARQIDTADRYTLRLVADDGDNPPVTKEFVIVLRRRRGSECPGEPPVIEHAPMDATTRLDPVIEVEITDDVGLRSQPYLVYATEDPGNPIDFDRTTLVPMELRAGDLAAGTWVGRIPNPVANAADGTSTPLYYLVSATDDDDADGDCDHRTDDPSSGMHRITLTAGGNDAVGVCEPCSFDVQCGGQADLCLPTGAGGRCGQACDGDDECDEGYACSDAPLDSVEGRLGRQCIPVAGDCVDPGVGCEDDGHEPDGTPAAALAGPALGDGVVGGMLCGGDEDWYALELDEPARVVATLEGDGPPPDLDLSLTTEAGVLIDASASVSSSEQVEAACLDPGTYLLRVHGFDAGPAGAYALELQRSACDAGGGGDCCAAHAGPGCDDMTVQACVCGMDSFCCESEWDGLCVGAATSGCGACGGTMGTGGCCAAQATPGCSDGAVEACVCAVDPYCCNTQWDATCVEEVDTEGCGACS